MLPEMNTLEPVELGGNQINSPDSVRRPGDAGEITLQQLCSMAACYFSPVWVQPHRNLFSRSKESITSMYVQNYIIIEDMTSSCVGE